MAPLNLASNGCYEHPDFIYDVAIVGYGPSGALAAHMLGTKGIHTLVIDRELEIYPKPRAMALDHEIARVLDNCGLLDDLQDAIAPFSDSQHFGTKRQLLRSISMAPEPFPLGYTPNMVFNQPSFETSLRHAVSRLPSVAVKLGIELNSLSQTEEFVWLNCREIDSGTVQFKAKYLIACDGASSRIRDVLNIELEDLGFDEPWVVVDILINPGKGENLPQSSAHFCDPERPVAYIEGPGNHRRWEVMLKQNEDPKFMQQSDQIWNLLARWVTPEDGKLWRAASYRFHALVAKHWREGRVFLAGDAAHQQPPILGQGMCQGVRDVTNLIWKLGLVLLDNAPDALLDSYETERQPHARELIFRIKMLGEVLCERDFDAAQRRDERLLAESGGVAGRITRQSIIPGLTSGLIDNSLGAGTLFPQPWIRTNVSRALMDKVQGAGWRLICLSPSELPQDIIQHCRDLKIRLIGLFDPQLKKSQIDVCIIEEFDGILENWFQHYNCTYVLVRPDHYVFGTANAIPKLNNMLTVLDKFLHALAV